MGDAAGEPHPAQAVKRSNRLFEDGHVLISFPPAYFVMLRESNELSIKKCIENELNVCLSNFPEVLDEYLPERLFYNAQEWVFCGNSGNQFTHNFKLTSFVKPNSVREIHKEENIENRSL
jgi:hypothetical protein